MKKRTLHTLLPLLMMGLLLSMPSNAEETQREIAFEVLADSSEVYTIVDEMPEIIGGIKTLYEKMKYPRIALDTKVEGRVFVQFVVDENGKVTDPKILKDIGAGCADAAVEALRNITFKPGLLDGTPVKVYYTLPVTFKIAN